MLSPPPPRRRPGGALRWTSPVLALALGLSACNPHVRRDPAELPIAMPEAFAERDEATTAEASPPAGAWWKDLGDPALDALMADFFGDNLELRQAWERVVQARARATQAGSEYWPQVNLELSSSRTKQLNLFFGGSIQNTVHSAQLRVSYELDVWGRIDALVKAAEADVAASEQDLLALAISLSADVVDTWYNLVEQRAQLALVESQRETNEILLELVTLRFQNGLAAGVDVLQQREQVLRAEAEIPPLRARIGMVQNQLAVLTGRPPSTWAPQDAGPLVAPPPLPALTTPGVVLARRPDVRAAQARLAAADHRIAAAVADRLPVLRINGNVGLQSLELSKILDDWLWSIAASAAAPLIDGGRREAEVIARKAAMREQLAGLGAVLLIALREIEDARIQEVEQRARLERLEQQVAVLRQVLDESRERYAEGVTDYLPVVTAVRSLQQAEQAELAARRQLLGHRVLLHRALGGDLAEEMRHGQPEAATASASPDDDDDDDDDGDQDGPPRVAGPLPSGEPR